MFFTVFVMLLVTAFGMGVGMIRAAREMVFMMRGLLVENARIITAMKIDVSFGHEVVGQKLTTVAEENLEDASLPALAPDHRCGLQSG